MIDFSSTEERLILKFNISIELKLTRKETFILSLNVQGLLMRNK